MRLGGALCGPALLALALPALLSAAPAASEAPHVLIVTIDTLRADRLSSYGYERDTTPNIDRFLSTGARFEEARTVEPLTGPALTSMITSLYPHEHGATRNGVRMREGLPSFTKILRRRGYATAAFVGNWTLNDHVTGLGEHFEAFEPVLTRKRWFFWSGEAGADDVNEAALDWLRERRRENPGQPVALWVHYVDPHAPYEYHEKYVERLGLSGSTPGRRTRYDTEVAFVDDRFGRLLRGMDDILEGEDRLTVFTADHGESLGEHNYWGHGRHCYEQGLRIPLGIAWPGRIEPRTISSRAVITDVAQTVLGLLGLPTIEGFHGFDWSPVLLGDQEPPTDRHTWHQSHRGSVKATSSEKIRQNGLLEVAWVGNGTKEILRVVNGNRRLFDLSADPGEVTSQVDIGSPPSEALAGWLGRVQEGLALSDELPPPALSEEELERLEALGYLD
jgi:arylsulfatase A-like enzyme